MLIGGVSYPLAAAAPGDSLAAACSPFAATMLAYYRSAIRFYCSTAFAAAAGAAYPEACEGTAACNAETAVRRSAPRFPLLAITLRDAEAGRLRTLEHEGIPKTYLLEYVLPALSPDELERVEPVFDAVLGIVLAVTYAQGDPNVPGAVDVLGEAGVESLEIGRSRVDDFEHASHRLRRLTIELNAVIRGEGGFVGLPITAVNASLDVGAEADGALFPHFVEVKHTP